MTEPRPLLAAEGPTEPREAQPSGPGERSPARPLLLGLGLIALATAAVLVLAATGKLGVWLDRGDPPAFREMVYDRPLGLLGRDLVITPADATPERIERLVLTVANADQARVLRLNVFTSEAAARRRRALIDQGIFAKSDDEDEPDPPQWAEVYPTWVGIYTRDPDNKVHQLSICLNDPRHEHCTVRRYP